MTAQPHPAPSSCPSLREVWATGLFERLLSGAMDTAEFERIVLDHWRDGHFIQQVPDTARWVHALATRPGWQAAGYAAEAPHLGFRSQHLHGLAGQPGAIHIIAPAERHGSGDLARLNRPLHQHDSGRMALITSGQAVFHVQRPGAQDRTGMVACPVQAGDLIFWPAWTPHTFDALQGFSLLSAMARYVSPAAQGFLFPVDVDPGP